MKVREAIDELKKNVVEGRELFLRPLASLLSEVSLQTLRQFENKWFLEKPVGTPFTEFIEAQNKEIIACLELETSGIGEAVRETLNLPLLTMETEFETDHA